MKSHSLLAHGMVLVWLLACAGGAGARDTEPAPRTEFDNGKQNGNSSSAAAGEVLYNGIRLPAQWPPNIRHLSREPMPVPYLQSPPGVIPIDVGRQLFVDDFLVESTTLQRSFHKAEFHPAAPILTPDKPWEMDENHEKNPPTAMPYSDGVWYDPSDQLFKMWYLAEAFGPTCLATSPDGIRWEKPSLDVVPGTNIVQPALEDGGRDSAMVWLDLEEANPQRRFKRMVNWRSGSRNTIHYSRDGIHWSESLGMTGTTWDRSTFFYNPFRKVWVFSIKGMSYWDVTETCSPDPEIRRTGQFGHMHRVQRFRRYREGPDLLAAALSWPYVKANRREPVTLEHYHDPRMWVWCDRLDPPRPHTGHSRGGEETEPEGTTPQLYNLDAVAYESLMLGLFCVWRGVPKEYPARDKINEVCLGFSRDGFHWDRPFREPVIPVSENPDDWNYSNVQSSGGCCLVVGDKLYFYVSGRMLRDKRTRDGFSSTGLAVMRRDGFASMDGDQAGGVLTTRPVKFQGKYLFVNVDAPSGELGVEVLDQQGKVIEPYGHGQCVPISGDSTRTRVRWRAADELADLQGETVRFRFHLRQGKLYSFWVSQGEAGPSQGYVAAGGPGFTSNRDTVGEVAYSAAATVSKR